MKIIEYFNREIAFEMKEANCVDITFDNIWFDFWHKLNYSIYNHCDDDRKWCIIMISIEEFVELMNKIIISSNKEHDGVVKKKRNFWCKLDIKGFEWSGNDIWKSNSTNFLKSKRDVVSVIMFFSNEIQKVIKSISKTVITKRIDWNDLIVELLMERLLIASTIILLSKIMRTRLLAHKLCQRRKVWRMTNISLKLIYLKWCCVNMRSENTCHLCTSSMSFNPFASITISWLIRENCIIVIVNQEERKRCYHWKSIFAAWDIQILRLRLKRLL